MLSIKDMVLVARAIVRGDQLMIGPVMKRYGPFRLHRYAVSLKGGELLDFSRLYVVVGEIPAPIFFPRLKKGADSSGYLNSMYERKGPFRDCVYVGEILTDRSSPIDLYEYVRDWLKSKETAIGCFKAHLASGEASSASNSRREIVYRTILTNKEFQYQTVRDALRELLMEYPDAGVAATHDVAKEEREVRRIQREYRWYFRLYDRKLR